MKKKELTKLFKKEIHDNAEYIDQSNEEDWHSLTLGWALGKGLSVDDAHDFASYIRYHTDLG